MVCHANNLHSVRPQKESDWAQPEHPSSEDLWSVNEDMRLSQFGARLLASAMHGISQGHHSGEGERKL